MTEKPDTFAADMVRELVDAGATYGHIARILGVSVSENTGRTARAGGFVERYCRTCDRARRRKTA